MHPAGQQLRFRVEQRCILNLKQQDPARKHFAIKIASAMCCFRVHSDTTKPRDYEATGTGLVDTGAPMCVFPYEEWKYVEDVIEVVDPLGEFSSMFFGSTRAGGKVTPSRAGLITLSFGAGDGIWSSPLRIVAKLMAQSDEPMPVLVGMNALEALAGVPSQGMSQLTMSCGFHCDPP